MDADNAVTGGPGKHEDIEEWHELVGPEESGYSEGETQLDKEAQN